MNILRTELKKQILLKPHICSTVNTLHRRNILFMKGNLLMPMHFYTFILKI